MTLYRCLALFATLCMAACAARTGPAAGVPAAAGPAPGTGAPASQVLGVPMVRPSAAGAPAAGSPAAGSPAAGSSAAAGTPPVSGSAQAAIRPGSDTFASGAALPADEDAFARTLAENTGLPLGPIQSALRAANYNATVARLIAPPRAAKPAKPVRRNWPAYRSRFVEPVRIRHGLAFWEDNAAALARAEQRYGVPAAVIVAIIGVETVYGRNMGNFRVLDALYTLAFSYPPQAQRDRSDYFREELGEYLAMTLAAGIDPASLRGSYAGAIGIPQFMPGSIRRYAVAARPGGTPDLIGDPHDAIESVANYLVEHGWRPALPVFADARLPADPSRLVDGGLAPTLNWRQLAAAGAREPARPAMAGVISEGRPGDDWRTRPLGIVNLDHGASGHTEYRLATENFFAITHYNRSYFYASAVADLAQALSQARTR